MRIGVRARAAGALRQAGRVTGALQLSTPSKDAASNRPARLTQVEVDRIAGARDGFGPITPPRGVDGVGLLTRQRGCAGLERRRLQHEPRVPPGLGFGFGFGLGLGLGLVVRVS